VPRGTLFRHLSKRPAVILAPRAIPNVSTAAIEYSEQVGR
jgi:hypothetical protein